MKSVNFQKKFEADLRKKYLPDLETEAGLVGLVGVQYDRVIVKVDSTKEDKKTVYEHDGVSWVYVNKVENIEHEISFTDDHNIYITDKDRKPKLMGDVLPYEDIDDLLDKDPAIYNKLYITKKGKLYYYNSNGAYKLVSGGGGSGGSSLLGTVATKAAIVAAYPNPDDYNSVIVTADEEHDGQTTWYLWLNNTWNYQGIYFPETLEISVSEKNTRADIVAPNVDFTIPIPYLVDKGHLSIYLEGELLLKGADYAEVGTSTYKSTKVQFKFTVPKEARLVFIRNVASYSGDSMITRLTSEVFLKYANDSWSGLNTLVSSLGFDNLTKSINVDATAGAVVKTVPSNCKVGTRLLYRKVDSSTNNVTINMPDGETVTRANLASLTLTSCDDSWEIEKVSLTRWVLRDGYESGSAATGTWTRDKNGVQKCKYFGDINTPVQAASTFGSATWIFPKAFISNDYSLGLMIRPEISQDYYGVTYINTKSVFATTTQVNFYWRNGATSAQKCIEANYSAEGRWYA